MEARYLRNIPALSERECAMLRTKKVCVVGCGGLGGNLIEHLARLGIGAIRAVDGDVFEASNLNRQLLSTVALLGSGKAEAAAQRIRQINPDVAAEAVHTFLKADNAEALIGDCDAVLDALDSIDSRRILAAACERLGIPYIFGAISGWTAQAAISLPGDRLVEKLYPADVIVRDKSVLSFTPALCAAMQTALCTEVLVGRDTAHGVLYCFDLSDPELTVIPMI